MKMKSEVVNIDKRYTDSNDIEVELTLLQHMDSQIGRADIKAEITLTVNALLIASTTIFGRGLANTILSAGVAPEDRLAGLCAILMFILLLTSTYLILLAVIPRITSPKNITENYFYFGSIAFRGEQKFIETFTKKEQSQIREMILAEVYALASIAQRKFVLIRHSHLVLSLALLFWALTQTLNILAK